MSRFREVPRDVVSHGDAAEAVLSLERRRRVPADDRHQHAELNKFFCSNFFLVLFFASCLDVIVRL